MRLEWLRDLARRDGPFATVSSGSRSRGHADRARSALAWAGAPAAVLDAVGAALAAPRPCGGDEGHVLVADDSGVLLHAPTSTPPDGPLALWGPQPDLMAVISAVREPLPMVVAGVDETGAGFLPPGPSASTEDGGTVRRRAVADECVALTGARLLVLTGEPASRARLRAALSMRARAVAVEVDQPLGTDTEALHRSVEDATDRLRDRERVTVLDRLDDPVTRSEGRVATGLAEVTAALRAGVVDTLVVHRALALSGSTVWAAAKEPTAVVVDHDVLARAGRDAIGPLGAASALVRAAALCGASVVLTDDPGRAPAGGTAALLGPPARPGQTGAAPSA
ncbi:MAG: hypothetical protein EKK42_02705 [Pseudonocardiaceae bacterium]|nr:MAG: hypothetical protein EKK42_02705 [Pseudonocardiaceae bacterium]